MQVTLSYGLSSSPFGAQLDELHAAVLDQCAWLDGLGVDLVRVAFPENHGRIDGGSPSPIVIASAVAARTTRVQITLGAVVAPLYHPIRLAEELAVLDLISGGRVSLILAAGYVETDCEMFGIAASDRPRLIEEAVDTLKKAWTGEPFEFRGKRVLVTPRPNQRPHPPIYLGGSSNAMARRAARIADGFLGGPEQTAAYRNECRRLGCQPSDVAHVAAYPPKVALITDDPDHAWSVFGSYALHAANAAGRQWTDKAPGPGALRPAEDVEALRASGQFLVLTPDECVDLCRRQGTITLTPLVGGFPPHLAQASLDLFETEVVPHLKGVATISTR